MGYLLPPNEEYLLGHSFTENRSVEIELIRLLDNLFEDIMLSLPSNERTLLVKSFARCCEKHREDKTMPTRIKTKVLFNEILDILGTNINKQMALL
jgi:hypothetical protein|tara:strand:- start:310 stop:597 length:288 start_codon:yes stop_codon:yes gene_type:complete